MRKFLFAALVAVLCAASASAQISGLRYSEGAKKLGSFRSRAGVIYYDPKTHGVFVHLSSTNQFAQGMVLYLAYSKDGALQTLKDLDAFLNEAKQDYNFSFDTCNGDFSYKGIVSSNLGTKSMDFYHDGAGVIFLSQYELIYISDTIKREYPKEASATAEN